jgi:hypothetical protein
MTSGDVSRSSIVLGLTQEGPALFRERTKSRRAAGATKQFVPLCIFPNC